MPRPSHPADLIAAIKLQRGEDPGPRHDVVIPNQNIFLPELEDDQQPALKKPVEPARAKLVTPTTPLPDLEGPALSEQNEGVSLSDGAGFYQGHELRLTGSERQQLRKLLGKVVLRQLKAEHARVLKGIGKA